MQHYISTVLGMALPGVSPAAKYFLVRTLMMVGRELCGATLNQLVVLFGMSKQSVLECRDELLAPRPGWPGGTGYLIEVRVCSQSPTSFRGRPRKGFQVNPGFLAGLDMAIAMAEVQGGQKEVERLGFNDAALLALLVPPSRIRAETDVKRVQKKVGQTGKKEALTVLNRLVLVLLWGVAARGGIVWIKADELVRLSGMSRSQIDSQLGKLQRLKFIRNWASGRWGVSALGSPPEIIVMEPGHPELSSVWQDGISEKHRLSMPNGALSNVLAAFHEAEAMAGLEKKITEQADVKNLSERESFQLQLLRNDLDLRKLAFDGWRYELGLPQGCPEILDCREENDDSTPGVYKAFLDADTKVQKYVVSMVCCCASRIITRQAETMLKRDVVLDVVILESIEEAVSVDEEPAPFWNRTLALWFYRHAFNVALDLLHWRERHFMTEDRGAEGVEGKGESTSSPISAAAKKTLDADEVFSLHMGKRGFLNVLIHRWEAGV